MANETRRIRRGLLNMSRTRASFAPRRNRGFSLIEMVAAFLVFAIGLGVLMSILTGSLQHTRQSADYTQAALRAQSILDTVGVGERVEEGHSDGRFEDDFRWEMDIEKIDPQAIEPPALAPGQQQSLLAQTAADLRSQQNTQNPAANAQQISPVELYQVALTMYWGTRGRERQARFVTLRAANPDPNQGMDLQGANPAMGRAPGAGMPGARTPGGKR